MSPINYTLAGRLAQGISDLNSSTPAGQMTIPLVDPATGKTTRYRLVEIEDSPPKICTRTVQVKPNDEDWTGSMNEYPQLLALEEMEQAVIPSPSSFRPSGSKNSVHVVPPSPPLKSLMSRFFSPSLSLDDAPSLFNESFPSILSSPSLVLAHTPTSYVTTRRPNIRVRDNNADASTSTMGLGLGIFGMLKADGTTFDGLGSLPPVGLALLSTEDDDRWNWAGPEEIDGMSFGTEQLLDEVHPTFANSPPTNGTHGTFPGVDEMDDIFRAQPAARSTPPVSMNTRRHKRNPSRPALTSLLAHVDILDRGNTSA